MPRQPFRPTPKDEDFGIGMVDLSDRSHLTSIVAEAMIYWSNVENQMALLLSVMLKVNTIPALTLYNELRNHRQQRDTIAAVAEACLTGVQLQAVKAILRLHESVGKERNDLAHGIFGRSAERPDILLWQASDQNAQLLAAIWHTEMGGRRSELEEELFRNFSYYSKAALETIRDDTKQLWDVLFRTTLCIREGQASVGHAGKYLPLLDYLATYPRMAAILSRESERTVNG